MKHTGTQDFETQRLICRRFAVDDWKDMLDNWASDPEIQSGYGEPVYEDASAVRELLRTYLLGYMRQDFYRWAIIEKTAAGISARSHSAGFMTISKQLKLSTA